MSCKSVIKGCTKRVLWKSVVQACQKLAKVLVAFGIVVGSCLIVYDKQKNNPSRTTYRNLSSLRGTPKPLPTCHPLSIPKGGGGGGGPPPPQINSSSIDFNPMGGGGGHYWFYQSFLGGRGGGGGGGEGPFSLIYQFCPVDKSILNPPLSL